MEYYSTIQKEWSNDINEPWSHWWQWKDPDTKVHILYDPTFINSKYKVSEPFKYVPSQVFSSFIVTPTFKRVLLNGRLKGLKLLYNDISLPVLPHKSKMVLHHWKQTQTISTVDINKSKVYMQL